MNHFSIDLHCHPGLKPYGKSFSALPTGKNSSDKRKRNSLWHYDPPQGLDIIAQKLLGMTKFSQSDFTALAYGQVRVICASLYSVEHGLVRLATGTGVISDFLTNLISGLGKERINFLQSNEDYFADLVNEYRYFEELDNVEIAFQGDIRRKYVIVKNYSDLEEKMTHNESNVGVETIYVILTVEGMHHVHSSAVPDETKILANVQALKDWKFKPFFITYAHHFYNGFCGHAESLADFIQDLMTNQEVGMDTGFTSLGWKVLKKLIDNTNGSRIHIDIKHMSALSRKQYIDFLKTDHLQEYQLKQFPLIVSHGACNGKISMDDQHPTKGLEITAARMYTGDINFYDNEIIEIARSGGIIGLQMDERRIASKQYKQSLRKIASKNERRHSNSKMMWNNIQHIVQLLDMNDIFAWDYIAIGTDNDGIIDPINLFWTSEDIDDLTQFIERHAYNFFADPGLKLKNNYNKIDAAEAVQRIFYSNSMEFFRKYFR